MKTVTTPAVAARDSQHIKSDIAQLQKKLERVINNAGTSGRLFMADRIQAQIDNLMEELEGLNPGATAGMKTIKVYQGATASANPTMDALCGLLWSFLSGDHFKAQNPYMQPEVRAGLEALRKAHGDTGDINTSSYLEEWKKRTGKEQRPPGWGDSSPPHEKPPGQGDQGRFIPDAESADMQDDSLDEIIPPNADFPAPAGGKEGAGTENGDRDPKDPEVAGDAVTAWLGAKHGDKAAEAALLDVLVEQGVLTPDERDGAFVEDGAREHGVAHVFLACDDKNERGPIIEVNEDGDVATY